MVQLTDRDRAFERLLRRRLGRKFSNRISTAERRYGLVGRKRPRGEASTSMFVGHHVNSGVDPGQGYTAWNAFDYHVFRKFWDTFGYHMGINHWGHAALYCPPSRYTYGAGERWNPITFHVVALADYDVFHPSKALLDTLYKILITCDDILGFYPWRPHGTEGGIRRTRCPGQFLAPHIWEMTGPNYGSKSPRPESYP